MVLAAEICMEMGACCCCSSSSLTCLMIYSHQLLFFSLVFIGANRPETRAIVPDLSSPLKHVLLFFFFFFYFIHPDLLFFFFARTTTTIDDVFGVDNDGGRRPKYHSAAKDGPVFFWRPPDILLHPTPPSFQFLLVQVIRHGEQIARRRFYRQTRRVCNHPTQKVPFFFFFFSFSRVDGKKITAEKGIVKKR